jgi:hypothetical protein
MTMDRSDRRAWLPTVILVVLVFAWTMAGFLFGTWWFVLLGIGCSLPVILLRRQQRRIRVGMFLTLLGGCIAASSAVSALVQVGADPQYYGRAGFGWAALGCAMVATAGPIIIRRPTIVTVILLLGGAAGGIAMSLFYINTFYVAALPLWWTAALLISLQSADADNVR